jgi:hypothetical protein
MEFKREEKEEIGATRISQGNENIEQMIEKT